MTSARYVPSPIQPTGAPLTRVLDLDLSGGMICGFDPDGNGRVGIDVKQRANRQARVTFGIAGDHGCRRTSGLSVIIVYFYKT
jgi:hypothetical protein